MVKLIDLLKIFSMSYSPLHDETTAAMDASRLYTGMSTVNPNAVEMPDFEAGAIGLYTGLEQADPSLREPPDLAHAVRHTRQRFGILSDLIASAADPRTADMLRLAEPGVRGRLEAQAREEIHQQNLRMDMPLTRFLGQKVGGWVREMGAFWNAGARWELLRGTNARTDHWIRKYVDGHFRGEAFNTLKDEDRRMVLEEVGLLANNFVAFDFGPLKQWAKTTMSEIPIASGVATHLTYEQVLQRLVGSSVLESKDMIPILRLLQIDPTYQNDLKHIYDEVMAYNFSDAELGLGRSEETELKLYQDAVARVEDILERDVGIQSMVSQIKDINDQLNPETPPPAGTPILDAREREFLQNQMHNLRQKRNEAGPALSKLVGQYNRIYSRLHGFHHINFSRDTLRAEPHPAAAGAAAPTPENLDAIIHNLQAGAERYRVHHEKRRTPHQLLYELQLHHLQHPPAPEPGAAPERVLPIEEAQKRAIISTMLLMDMVESNSDEGYAVRRARKLARGRVTGFLDRISGRRLSFEDFVKNTLLTKEPFKELEGFDLKTRAEAILEWVHAGKLKEEDIQTLIKCVEFAGQDQLLGKGKLELDIDVRPLVHQLNLAWYRLRADEIFKSTGPDTEKILALIKEKAGSITVPPREPRDSRMDLATKAESRKRKILSTLGDKLKSVGEDTEEGKVIARKLGMIERIGTEWGAEIVAEIVANALVKIPAWLSKRSAAKGAARAATDTTTKLAA